MKSSAHRSAPPMIEAQGLQKSYGDVHAVKSIDLVVYPGEIVGFLGHNGAGKTTTMKMLVGLLQPSAGRTRISGFDIQTQPMEAKALLGYVPDHPYLPEKLTAQEFLDFLAGLYQIDSYIAHQRAEELLHVFDLDDRSNEFLGGYSHGMRQKVALAGALLHHPRAFFLDEPTVGLDPRSARMIKDLLRHLADEGMAILMSTHILEFAERMCDRLYIIDHGEMLASGTLDELRTEQNETLEEIFLSLTGQEDLFASDNE